MSVLSKQKLGDIIPHVNSFSDFLKLFNVKNTLGLFTTLALLYIGNKYFTFRFFSRRGLPTPSISFFTGNLRELQSKNYSEALKEWTERFGKTYGYFEGTRPVLVTSDLEIIQDVFVRKHLDFASRRPNTISLNDSLLRHCLVDSKDLKWKFMRSTMNQIFSNARLKELRPSMVTCVDRLLEILQLNESDTDVDVTLFFNRYVMDIIWACGFGIDINLQSNKNSDIMNSYLTKCQDLFTKKQAKSCCLNGGSKLFAWLLDIVAVQNKKRLLENEERSKNDDQTPRDRDCLQLLIDAFSTERVEFNLKSSEFTKTGFLRRLTKEEVEMNSILFMLAGYETTSTTLVQCIYMLAKHQNEQAKLRKEIESVFGIDLTKEVKTDAIDFQFEKLQRLQYMQNFIYEVLRMYPISNLAVSRECTKATKVKDICLPVHSVVAVDVLSLHNDQTLWGDVSTSTFYPNRFSSDYKRDELAFMGFGQGPRNCLGIKFALQQIKLALVKLLVTYKIEISSSMQGELALNESIVRAPKK